MACLQGAPARAPLLRARRGARRGRCAGNHAAAAARCCLQPASASVPPASGARVWAAQPVGLALSLLAAPAALGELLNNATFCATGLAWVLAQTLKVFTRYFATRSWDVRVLFDSGGMPSSHTSLVVGLATSVAVQHGLGSSLFVVCLAFALIVMYDAAGVRRHAGKQAEVLNALVEDYFQGHPVSEQELKERLGHTPLQVGMGALLGVAVALAYHARRAM